MGQAASEELAAGEVEESGVRSRLSVPPVPPDNTDITVSEKQP